MKLKLPAATIAVIVPVFMLLAIANAAALYFAQSREISRTLEEQAVAAIVSIGEYVAARPELLAQIDAGEGKANLLLGMAQIQNLKNIYLADGGRCCRFLIGQRPDYAPPRTDEPMAPVLSTLRRTPYGAHVITAAMLLPDGAVLAVDIDAEPMIKARSQLHGTILWMLLGTAAVAFVVALLVIRWIKGDLRLLRQLLAGDAGQSSTGSFRFSEAKDTAEAIELLNLHRNDSACRYKKRLLAEGGNASPDEALNALTAPLVADRYFQFAAVDVVAGCLGSPEAGLALASCEGAGFACCALIDVGSEDPADRYALASLARDCLEGAKSLEDFAGRMDFLHQTFFLPTSGLAWIITDSERVRQLALGSGSAPREEALPAKPQIHPPAGGSSDLCHLGWTSAREWLLALRTVNSRRGLAILVVPR